LPLLVLLLVFRAHRIQPRRPDCPPDGSTKVLLPKPPRLLRYLTLLLFLLVL
jgi:hypothetical protein